MPNWCQNELTITGPSEELDRFQEAARGTPTSPLITEMPLSLERLYPIPDHIDTTESVGASDNKENWYTWCGAHWGTKWDIGASWGLEREPNQLFLGFETAWSPPVAAFTEKIAPDFPRLTFVLHFEEPEMAIAGEWEWREGKLVRDEECALSPEWKEADIDDVTAPPSRRQSAG